MRCTYGPLAVFTAGGAGQPDVVLEDAEGGIFSATLNGSALPIYDFNDNPISTITSSPSGQAQWRVDDQLTGWVRFGSVSVRVMSNDAGDLLQQTQAAVGAAQSAQTAAETALAQVQAAIAAGVGSGTSTGLPVGTTLANIPDSTDRHAVSTAEQTKLAGIAPNATRLLLGTLAGQAREATWIPTAADVGAVISMTPGARLWFRTAAQGAPDAAAGASDSGTDWVFLENS